MARRGRKAKAKAQHELENTVNATRHQGEDLDPGGSIGPPPDYLPEEAASFWRRAAQWMERMGIAKACDEVHLEAAAMLWYRLQVVNRRIAELGVDALVDEKGKRTGYATEAMYCTEKLRMWYNEVGFVPSARAAMRLPVGDDGDGEGDLETEIFGAPKLKAVK